MTTVESEPFSSQNPEPEAPRPAQVREARAEGEHHKLQLAGAAASVRPAVRRRPVQAIGSFGSIAGWLARPVG